MKKELQDCIVTEIFMMRLKSIGQFFDAFKVFFCTLSMKKMLNF